MNNQGEKEPYIGSVRFFRHLILSTVACLILIPTIAAVIFGMRTYELSAGKEELNKELNQARLELKQLHSQVELEKQKQDELEAAMEDLASVIELQTENYDASEAVVELPRKWNLILVNEAHPLPSDYNVELVEIAGGQKVDVRIKEPLEEMMSEMKAEGMSPLVCSGYRSIQKQSNLFHEYIDDKVHVGWEYADAFYKAKTRIALPGTSEHHTGLAVDIVGYSHQSLDDAQADTKEARWLKEHCAEYGFILRYPENKTDITGIDYESWHFRYVGRDAASYIMTNELTLEEYIETIY